MTTELQSFFQTYASGWDAADAESLADHYTVPAAISSTAGPETFSSRQALLEKLKLYCAHFASIGYDRAEFSCHHYAPVGETSAFVDLHWSIRRKQQDPYRFGTAYTLQRNASGWRIFSAVPYAL